MKTCQHCQTEITNPRAKNCPTCSQLMNDAYKANAYNLATAAVAEARELQLTGADVHTAIRSAIASGNARENDYINARRAERKARQDEQERRQNTPRHLRPFIVDDEEIRDDTREQIVLPEAEL